MGQFLHRSLLALLFAVPLFGQAGASAPPAVQRPAAAPFVTPVSLRGNLGERQIQMHLRLKPEMTDAVEGEYFVFGHGWKVLVAGEVEGEDIFMEESENGTDVSGEWNGKLVGDVFSGEWMSADGAVRKPFSIRIVSRASDNISTVSDKANGKIKSH